MKKINISKILRSFKDMKVKEFKIKFAEKIKTKEYQNVAPELEITLEVEDQENLDSAFDRALLLIDDQFKKVKDRLFIHAGGKKIRRFEKWEFEEDDLPY